MHRHDAAEGGRRHPRRRWTHAKMVSIVFLLTAIASISAIIQCRSLAFDHALKWAPTPTLNKGSKAMRSEAVLRNSSSIAHSADAINVSVYVTENIGNSALSVFKTGALSRYGSGRVNFALVDHGEYRCNRQCIEMGRPLLAGNVTCLAATEERRCKYNHLKCNYPNCRTLVTNDELCDKANFDAREYYTSELDDKGYLPLGPNIDAWTSFEKVRRSHSMEQMELQNGGWFRRQSPEWQPPALERRRASERRYAFNAIFSQNTNGERKELARLIIKRQRKNGTDGGELEIFATMARKWSLDVNSNWTEQLNTDDYAKVIHDSVFTLAPAGHNPESYRLYEAVEAGSIPIMVEGDLHATKPCRGGLKRWHDAPIVVLKSWDKLYPTVTKLMEDTVGLDGRQADLARWYDGHMREWVRKFEDFVLGNGNMVEAGRREPVRNGTLAADDGVEEEQPADASDEPDEIKSVNNGSANPTEHATTQRNGKVRYILGHSRGHAGTTAVQKALSKGGCPWKTVGAFENIPSSIRAYDYGPPTLKKYEPGDADALKKACKTTIASFGRRLPDDLDGDVAYLDMGHYNNRGRVLECLAAELKGDVTFVRIRRARYDIARSFSIDLTTPCTGTEWISPGEKVRQIGSHPRLSLCPRSTETGGPVDLPVDDEVWDGLTPFQKFLWYADEMEARWHSLRAAHDGPEYLEVTWSNSPELVRGVSEVRKALGCSAIESVANEKGHVKHDAGSLNCTELIWQDLEYRRKLNYDEATDRVLFSYYSTAYHGNTNDCMETESELQRALKSLDTNINAALHEADHREETDEVVEGSITEHMQHLFRRKSLSLAVLPPGKVNSLRRALAAEVRTCYEHHFSEFAEYTKARLKAVKRHLSLHIPKAGGTSLCDLAKSAGMKTPESNNCWEENHGYPLWLISKFVDRREWTIGCDDPSRCDEFVDAEVPEFTMNENYLDHPLLAERLYSVVLREPIDRAMSQERHLGMYRKSRVNKMRLGSSNSTVYDARVELARHNYMTWALAVAKTEPFGKRVPLLPRREHLEVAKVTLSQFDFLLELSQNSTCEKIILKKLGMGDSEIGRGRTSVGSKLGQSQDRGSYASWNDLDIELHQYARRLMELDCEFFLLL